MPLKCPVCSNSDFHEIDGLYYCTECQTQTEDLILQEVSVQMGCCTGLNEVRRSQLQTHPANWKPKPSLGRPWTIYEAYQVIILAQADSLIAQGASEDLKDIVFTIWANYLSRLGVAFCRYEQLVPDIVAKTKYGRFRELYRGTLSNPLNSTFKPLIEDKTATKTAVGSDENTDEGLQVDDEKEESIVFMNYQPVDFRTRHDLRELAANSPEWMNLIKTITICYIGLMFTNPNFLPCDIVRLVYDCKVPFLSVTQLLPADMVLSSHDHTLFESTRFDSSTFVAEITKLLTYLHLDKMPKADITVLVPRFVKELCLPATFATCCFNLMAMVPFYWYNSSKTNYNRQEVVAMGYIILALKVALGLDDTTELKLSRYSHKLQRLLTPEVKLFVWSDWQRFMMRKSQDEFSAFRELTGDIYHSKLQHLDELLECYSKTESDKKRHSIKRLINRHMNLQRSFKPEFRKLIRTPLEVALDRVRSHRDFKRDAARRNKADLARRSEEFQLCTMNHIVDVSGLQEQFEDILSENKAVLEKLLKKYSLPRTEIFEYNLISRKENMKDERHGSYLWLLHLASSIIDCPMLELDKITVHLQKYLIMKMNGDVKPGVVCTQNGSSYSSEKKFGKVWPFTPS